MRNLVFDEIFEVVESHPHHAGKRGKFKFLGGPKSDIVVLEDRNNSLFAVGMNDIVRFDPAVDNVIQEGHIQTIKLFDHNDETFDVLRRERMGDWVVLWVFYPNCPNSHKVMVYRGNAPAEDVKQIDPHFGREGSPIARFAATEEGWNLAKSFAASQIFLSRGRE